MATLAVLGALLLGMGQRDPWLPTMVVVAAALSIWLTDVTARVYLNRNFSNLAALGTMAVCTGQWFALEGDQQIMVIGKLLIYLQIILLFLKKDDRAYWQLVMLSLLQVVVAAIFSQGIWFGVLLVVYLLVGMSALSLLFFYGQWNRHRLADRPTPAPTPLPQRRWPLAEHEAEFSSIPSGRILGAVRPELFLRFGMIGLGALALTPLLFFTVPRFGRSSYRGTDTAVRRVVGFNDQVTLGEIGTIIESREEVMRVRLSRAGGEPYDLQGSLYLRGAILTHYIDGGWKGLPRQLEQPTADAEPTTDRRGDLELPTSRRPLVRQDVEIEPVAGREELFAVWPFGRDANREVLTIDSQRRRLRRPKHLRNVRFAYTLTTTALVNGEQVPLVPRDAVSCRRGTEPGGLPRPGLPRLARLHNTQLIRWESLSNESLMPLLDEDERRQFAEEDGNLLSVLEEERRDKLLDDFERLRLPNLKRRAQRWIDDAGVSPDDPYALARLLERKLRDSGEFQYSLSPQHRNLSIDPIEDFVTSNPRGHCEYFATALTLMLQAQGAPARMVMGYKCGEFNRLGGFHRVRQLHAHAWVEVYLPAEKIPVELLCGDAPENWADGGWLRLDPTPGADGPEDSAAGLSLVKRIRRGMDFLQDLWSDYIVEMDRHRQRTAIYEPIVEGVKDAWRNVRDPAWWRRLLTLIGGALDLRHIGGWLRAGLLAVVALVGIRFFGRRFRRMFGALGRLLPGQRTRLARGARAEIAFYRRLEALLARHGMIRTASQTQREFAAAAAAALRADGSAAPLAPLPGEVAEAFYRVRFGHAPLDAERAQAVERALLELATGLASANGDRSQGRR